MRIYDFEGKKNISGERIREARLKLRLSQSDLAARVQVEGVTMERDSISRIEQAKKETRQQGRAGQLLKPCYRNP